MNKFLNSLLFSIFLLNGAYASERPSFSSNIEADNKYQFYFADTDADDNVISALISGGYIEKVKVLDFRNTRVTNDGLEMLADQMLKGNFKQLQVIMLDGVKGDLSEGVRKFAGAMIYNYPHPSKEFFDCLEVSSSSVDDETRELIEAMAKGYHGGFVYFSE